MRKYCAFFLVTEDDFCLRETTDALVSLGVRDYLFCVPKTYWNGSIVPESKLAGIHRVEANLVNWGCTVVRIDIDIHEYEGLKYIEMETRVRNRCLRDLERKGYEHFLIIDGDEYWRRGPWWSWTTSSLTSNQRPRPFKPPLSWAIQAIPSEGHKKGFWSMWRRRLASCTDGLLGRNRRRQR